LRLELVGELADLGRRVAPVATKGLQERELALLGPSRHGLGDTCKMSATSAVWRLRGPSGVALPLGGLPRRIPFVRRTGCGAGPGVAQVRPVTTAGPAPPTLLAPLCVQDDRTSMQTDPTARHSLLGLFQRVCYPVQPGAPTHRSDGGELHQLHTHCPRIMRPPRGPRAAAGSDHHGCVRDAVGLTGRHRGRGGPGSHRGAGGGLRACRTWTRPAAWPAPCAPVPTASPSPPDGHLAAVLPRFERGTWPPPCAAPAASPNELAFLDGAERPALTFLPHRAFRTCPAGRPDERRVPYASPVAIHLLPVPQS
jgi:hypothetical protein